MHEALQQHVAHGRWTYYALQIPKGAVGFQIQTDRYDQIDGQPWIFIQQGRLPTEIRAPFRGVPNAGASAQECFHCRAQVLLACEPFEFSSSGDVCVCVCVRVYPDRAERNRLADAAFLSPGGR